MFFFFFKTIFQDAFALLFGKSRFYRESQPDLHKLWSTVEWALTMTLTYPDAWPLTELLPVWDIWTDFHLLWMQHILLTASQLWVFEEIREPHRETKETHLRRFRLQSASNSSIQWRREGRSTAVTSVWPLWSTCDVTVSSSAGVMACLQHPSVFSPFQLPAAHTAFRIISN